MAPVAAQPGSYFEFDTLATAGTLVVFRSRSFEESVQMAKGIVNPVITDFLVLDGVQKGTVVRNERIIGSGITSTLRRQALGADVVAQMAWGKNGGTSYVQANPPTDAQMAVAVAAFNATNDDPYTAMERRANGQSGPVAAAAPAPAAAPPVQAPPAPAADAGTLPPAPWGQPAAPAAAAQPEPVAAAAGGDLW